MSKRFFLMLLGVALVLGGIFGFKAFVDQQIAEFFDEMPEPTATINAATVETDRWAPQLRAVGDLEAVQGATLSFEAQGIVDRIHFANGAFAEAGETLVELDTELDEAELESLRAEAQLSARELERARGLVQRNDISDSEFQRRATEAQQAQAAVNAQEARIRQKRLRAPFDGQLGIRQVNEGQFVGPGDPIVVLESLDPLYVNFTLPERRLANVERGQSVEVTVDAYGETFEGQITAIEPRVRAASRMFRVQAMITNEDHRLRPGQFARVTLQRGEPEEGLVVPQTAVRFAPWGNSVFVIFEDDDGDKRVEQRLVEIGERRGDLVRIVDGLEEGDEIAVSGLLKLQNDTPVKITEDAQPDAERDPRPANR
ncbi:MULTISPECIES: efflux RND transporter periplasmic adaptor subunit [unclassified Thioalkalivibrio]|uniref:efflux RND transporter periplasmic adaptor subunit n=1 Tax=unclassified Thioalkalivibrio TaxID=2621013 RepID=UPI00035CF8B7|nr:MULTISPECIES: efflux RND transporter periplasmic adaptor subunit [unclassified Thioalkalivibrio]